ncbi:MAG: AarF/UbiB family protein [Bacteroidota bacterium]
MLAKTTAPTSAPEADRLGEAPPVLGDEPPVLVVPAPEAAIEVARPARRRFRLTRAYAAALRVALSYLWFDALAKVRGTRWAQARRPALHARNGRRVRTSILRLRGLFIKAGQLGSALTNLLPEPFRVELEGLQDRVPASPADLARARIEAELGAPVEALFADFSAAPVASASLAQVHRARLGAVAGSDGTGGDGQAAAPEAAVREVAVKVQHADIDAIARLDLRAIETILRVVGRWFGIRGLREQFREIEAVILGELDFTREAENAAEIGPRLGAGVRVPAVIPERSTARVLTTEFVDGIRAGDLEALDAAGVDRHAVAERILDAYGAMIFRDGLYHADPHPGNLLVVPDPEAPGGFELVFLDFGAVARLTPEMRRGLAEMIAATLGRDAAGVTAALATMGFIPEAGASADAVVLGFVEQVHTRLFRDLDPRAFRLGDLTLDYAMARQAETFEQMADLGVSVTDLASAFRVPRDWILMERTAILLVGLCGALAPNVNPLTVIEPYVRPLVGDVVPEAGRALWARLEAAGRVLLGLPERIDRTLDRAEAGTLEVRSPDTLAAAARVEAGLRRLSYTVGAVGSGGVGYAAYALGDGGIALGLAGVAALCALGALLTGRR